MKRPKLWLSIRSRSNLTKKSPKKITLDTSFPVSMVLVREQWQMKLLPLALKESALVVKTDFILASVTTKNMKQLQQLRWNRS